MKLQLSRFVVLSQAFAQAARGEGAPIGWYPPRHGAAAPDSTPIPPEAMTRSSGGEAPSAPTAAQTVSADGTAASPEKPTPPTISARMTHEPQGVPTPPAAVNSGATMHAAACGMSLRPPEPPPGRRRPPPDRQEQPLDAPADQAAAPAPLTSMMTGSLTPQPSLAFKEAPPIALPSLSLAPKLDATTLGSGTALTVPQDAWVPEPSRATFVAKEHVRPAPEPEGVMSLALTKSPAMLRERASDVGPANVSMEMIRDLLAAFTKDLLAAFGSVMTCAHDRRANETVDMVLTAQNEQTALILQGMADQREYYGATLERAVLRLTRDVAPESFINIGEVFQRSAAEISSALRCGEHMELRVLETLREISARLGHLLTQVNELGVGSKAQNQSEVRAEKPAETPNLRVLPTGTGERKRAGNILERIGDDSDDSEVR